MGLFKKKNTTVQFARKMPSVEDKRILVTIASKKHYTTAEKFRYEKDLNDLKSIIEKCSYQVETIGVKNYRIARQILKLVDAEIAQLKENIEREKLIQKGISYGAMFADLSHDISIEELRSRVKKYKKIYDKAQVQMRKEEKLMNLRRERDIDLFKRGLEFEFSMRDICNIAYKIHFQMIHLQAKMNVYIKKVRRLHSHPTMPVFKYDVPVQDLYNQVHEIERVYAHKEKAILAKIVMHESINSPLYDKHLEKIEHEARAEIKKNYKHYHEEAMKLIEAVDKYNQHAFAYVLTLKHQIENEKKVKKDVKKNKPAKMHKKAQKISARAEKKWHKSKKKAK